MMRLAERVCLAAALNVLLCAPTPCGATDGRPLLSVPFAVWHSLKSGERDQLATKFVVEIASKDRFARIVYVQGVNESMPGTTTGAELGSLLGQAQYIDKSNWRNYSAKNQIGAAILGSLIGSALDSPPRASFRQVYTVKSADGSISTIERVSPSPIHAAPGLCVDTASFAPVRDQYCDGGLIDEVSTALKDSAAPPERVPRPSAMSVTPQASSAEPAVAAPLAAKSQELIVCRLGATASTQTTQQKCSAAGGVVQP